MNLPKYTVLISLILFINHLAALSQTYVFLHNDTLTISNAELKRQYLWNKGELISLKLFNKKNNTFINPEHNSAKDSFEVYHGSVYEN